MHRVPVAPKHTDGATDSRAFGRNVVKESGKGFLNSVMTYVWPDYGQSIYTMTDMTNVYNLAYLGQMFVGTPAQEF